MKPYCLQLMVFVGVLGVTSSAIAMMRAPDSGSPIQQKPQHETKKHPAGKTPSSQQQNYQTVPLTVPVKQNR